MTEQYFGHKELYQVTLRAKTSMQFGNRYIEAEEPVLYFNNVNMSLLTEQNRPVFARGGWGNMPRVIWDERSEVQFQMVEGVMSQVGMGILLSANVLTKKKGDPLYINKREEFYVQSSIDDDGQQVPIVYLSQKPVSSNIKKSFIFEYERNAIQKNIYGKLISDPASEAQSLYKLELYKDKNCSIPAEKGMNYVVDYYYEYRDEALIYSVEKERFNGLFSLEAKFYSQDENEGHKFTNVLYMPKVRIVSGINLRLGERADPTVSTFNIIGMPEAVGDQRNVIMEITRLSEDLDAEI